VITDDWVAETDGEGFGQLGAEAGRAMEGRAGWEAVTKIE
jgi:hypothetical protein